MNTTDKCLEVIYKCFYKVVFAILVFYCTSANTVCLPFFHMKASGFVVVDKYW